MQKLQWLGMVAKARFLSIARDGLYLTRFSCAWLCWLSFDSFTCLRVVCRSRSILQRWLVTACLSQALKPCGVLRCRSGLEEASWSQRCKNAAIGQTCSAATTSFDPAMTRGRQAVERGGSRLRACRQPLVTVHC